MKSLFSIISNGVEIVERPDLIGTQSVQRQKIPPPYPAVRLLSFGESIFKFQIALVAQLVLEICSLAATIQVSIREGNRPPEKCIMVGGPSRKGASIRQAFEICNRRFEAPF
jgi:hypothetical protein